MRTHTHFLLSLSCCLPCEVASNPLTINVQITQQSQGGTWFSSCVGEGLGRERCGNVKSRDSAGQPRCLSRTKKMLLIATVVVCKTEMLKENCNPPTPSLRDLALAF